MEINEAKKRVLAVYPDAYESFDGSLFWIWEKASIPRQSMSCGLTSDIAWTRSASKLTPTAIGHECIKDCALPEGHTGDCEPTAIGHEEEISAIKLKRWNEKFLTVPGPTAIPAQEAKKHTQLQRALFIIESLRMHYPAKTADAEKLYETLYGDKTAPPEVKK